IDQTLTVDRMDSVCILCRLTRLLGLQLANIVPPQVELGELSALEHSLLVAILSDITYPKFRKLAHEARRMKLCDDDERHIGFVSSRGSSRRGDSSLNRVQA